MIWALRFQYLASKNVLAGGGILHCGIHLYVTLSCKKSGFLSAEMEQWKFLPLSGKEFPKIVHFLEGFISFFLQDGQKSYYF